jgi:PhnB protein
MHACHGTIGQRTVDVLEQVFDAALLRVMPRDDGRLAHAEVRIEDTVVMLADAVVVEPPTQEGDGDRRGGFTDAGGTTWWVSTQVRCAPPRVSAGAAFAERLPARPARWLAVSACRVHESDRSLAAARISPVARAA